MSLPWGPGIEWVDPERSLGKPLPRWSRRGHLNTICMLFFPLVWAVLSCSVRPFPSPPRLLCPWGCSRLEYWSGLPCPPPRDLPNQGSNPASHIADGFFNICATREAQEYWYGQPIPSPGYLPDLEIGLGSPALQVDFFYQLSYQGRPNFCHFFRNFFFFLLLWPGRGENSGLGPAVAPEVHSSGSDGLCGIQASEQNWGQSPASAIFIALECVCSPVRGHANPPSFVAAWHWP